MGCTSCGTGKPNGCKSNGGCSSGGCNRLNVYDWLADLPIDNPEDYCKIVEVSFNQGSRKDYYKNNTGNYFSKGDIVAVEGISGFDVGTVNLSGELVRFQLKKKRLDEHTSEFKKILRLATDNDIAKWKETKLRERQVLIRSRAIARQLNLNLKMSEVEIQADARKATFYYIADERVDFRELIRLYANEFKVKVEMKQIGARQEAGKIGGIGSCGRELCCSTWLTDFKSVNTNAARYQNLSINQTKLSGQCGRLKCCLNYELDTYLDALQYFPDDADVIEVAKGRAFLVKKDIFRNLMWYTMSDSTKHYPLAIETVKSIKAQNQQGIRPEALETVEIVSEKPKEVEPEFVDVVGQITLKSLEKNNKKRKSHGKKNQENKQNGSKGVPGHNHKHKPPHGRRNTHNKDRNPPKNQQ
jgi:cell fate regulator YaaT (PSP1 superfamily)